MINVSTEWKNKFNQTLLPEMFVEISYRVTEPGLQEDATASSSSAETFSNMNQIVRLTDKNSESYATLDYGGWGLDGSFEYFDGSPVDPGYVDSGYSDDNGEFAENQHPRITIDFSERHDMLIPGMVITWGDAFHGWAVDFKVSTYNSSGLIDSVVVTGNQSVESTVWLDMVGYSKITIEIMKWSHPYQRVRCLQIMLGVEKIYTKSDLLGYDHTESVDLLSAALPLNQITFRLRNDDNRWNPDNPSGSERYLIEQQELEVRYGMDVNGTKEWIDGGTFWLSEWNTPSNGLEAVFTARDAIDFMNDLYGGPRSGTLYEIAVAALTQADLPVMSDGSVRFVVSESLQSIDTDFTEDASEYMISDVLQMVAHAGCCVFYQDRKGKVHIEPWSEEYTNFTINPDVSYSHPEYTINKPLKSVSVAYGSDQSRVSVEVGTRGGVQTVDNPLIITREDAVRVGGVARDILMNRKVVSGEFRSDLRLDALDNVMVKSKYATNIICITDISYSSTGGSFRGKYTGRVVSIDLESVKIYNGELYLGEVW